MVFDTLIALGLIAVAIVAPRSAAVSAAGDGDRK
jgi:hypothetical protein